METPSADLPGTYASINQTALSLFALTISVETPFTSAMKVASASSSLIFLAIENPSHQSVEAGLEPPPTVGAFAGTVLLTTAGVDPSSSSKLPIDDPHISAIASSPDSHSGTTAPVLYVRKSGLEYSISDFNISRVATPFALLTEASAVPGLKNSPP